ncbi:HlyD family efflux transporter periplasmic adaptor subunit [bacterium]|nr:HlyD family efflux transporter periplasmic adaptor subunit [bacterium]
MRDLRILLLLIAMIPLAILGCDRFEREEAPESDATNERSFVEEGGLRLDAETQAAIGLRIEPVERRQLRETMTLPGWLLAIPGSEVAVRSPATGFFFPAEPKPAPAIGQRLEVEERLGSIRFVFSPQERAQLVAAKEEADTLMQQSRVSMEIAAAQLDAIRSGSRGVVAKTRIQELEEIAQKARVALNEAQEKLPFLPKEPYDETLGIEPVGVTSAVAGHVTDLYVRPRQFVLQGDPLWTVADWSTLWLRVPVFTGDLSRIDRERPCRIRADRLELSGRPIDVPRASEPGRRTVDLYFEVEYAMGALRPGAPVEVELSCRESSVPGEQAADQNRGTIVVPQSAVLWDGFGSAWVYVATNDETFRRQRVETEAAIGDLVAVRRGLDDKDRIVIQGAAALRTEQFKDGIPLDDD